MFLQRTARDRPGQVCPRNCQGRGDLSDMLCADPLMLGVSPTLTTIPLKSRHPSPSTQAPLPHFTPAPPPHTYLSGFPFSSAPATRWHRKGHMFVIYRLLCPCSIWGYTAIDHSDPIQEEPADQLLRVLPTVPRVAQKAPKATSLLVPHLLTWDSSEGWSRCPKHCSLPPAPLPTSMDPKAGPQKLP